MKLRKVSYILFVFGFFLIIVGFFVVNNNNELENSLNENNNEENVGGTPIRDNNKEDNKGRHDEEETDEVAYEGDVVSSNNINLKDYSSNIVIKAGGEYMLSGSFNHSIYIDSDDSIILNLNNVNINASNDAAIVNINNNSLIINVNHGTDNVVADANVESYFDGCIFSKGTITIKGKGNLKIKGNQVDGEGIATKNSAITISESNISIYSVDDGINTGGDGGTITINSGNLYIESGGDAIDSNKDIIINGGIITAYAGLKGVNNAIDVDDSYSINGGTIIGTGTDRLTLPDVASKNKIICFEFVDKIPKDTLVTLLNEKENVIFSFKLKTGMNSLIYSSNKLVNGKYYLYTDGSVENSKYIKGKELRINGINEFIIEKNVNSYIEK